MCRGIARRPSLLFSSTTQELCRVFHNPNFEPLTNISREIHIDRNISGQQKHVLIEVPIDSHVWFFYPIGPLSME